MTETNEPLEKRIGYVAHQVGGDVAGNVNLILAVLEDIRFNEDKKEEWKDLIPIAPYLGPLSYLNDDDAEQRALGIEENLYYFKRGFMDEVILAGPNISRGMKEEIKLAVEYNIPVSCYNPDLQDELDEILTNLGEEV